MTVLHVVPEDSWRGAQVYAGRLRDALSGHQGQRHVLASLFAAPDAALRPDIVLGVRSGLLRRVGLDPRAAHRLARAIDRHDVDVVVAHGGEALKYAVAARRRTPVIYYKLGLSTMELSRWSRIRLYRLLARRVSLGVGVSTPIREQLHDDLDIPGERLRVVANGRDPREFQPGPRGAKGDHPLVLFVGELEVGKRPDMFLDIVALLREQGVTFRAAMVGGGPLRSHLQRRARGLDVVMLGVRDDVPDLLRAASVLVLTSARETEGMPGVLVEAGLTGIPVVSTAAAGCRDIVLDGTTGFVVDTDDVADCASAVRRLCRDPEAAAHMGDAAREHCIANFTVDHTARSWAELIAELEWAQPRV